MRWVRDTALPGGLEPVAARVTAGGLEAAERDVVQPLVEQLLIRVWPPARMDSGTFHSDVRRAANRVLDWLEAQGPGTWQDRWDRSGANASERGWYSLLNATQGSARAEAGYAVDALILLRAIAPSHGWFMASKRIRLWREWSQYHDAQLYQDLAPVLQAGAGHRTIASVPVDLMRLTAVTRKSLPELTRGDFLAAREVHQSIGRSHRSLHAAWHYAKAIGLLAGEPAELTMVIVPGPSTPQQLVDKFSVRSPRMRALLIDYLTERAATCDHSTLHQLARHLVKLFWCDLEQHNPGLDSLALAPQQAKAWQERVAVLASGRPRRDLADVVGSVRTLYNDLSVWSHENPRRWIEFVAPCPFAFRPTARLRRIARSQQITDMHDRTRALTPQLARFAAFVAADLARAERTLAAAAAVTAGSTFYRDGESWIRRHRSAARTVDAYAIFARGPSGAEVDLTAWEERAFWTWACVEVLRHAGLRIEEMLELTHLSVRPFRKPTGEIVPLLQVAPSKKDRERVLPASPALAHALGRILTRHATGTTPGSGSGVKPGTVPLTRRRDEYERTFTVPMPYLFQRVYGSGRRVVMSSSQFRSYLKIASAKAGIVDNNGAPMHFTPHDFRRLWVTDLVTSGMPIHIAATLAGHQDINTTRDYTAIYPTDVINHYDAYITRRRQERPSDEYRQPTAQELRDFADHFGRRRVELGDCVRPYATTCTHEHACIRCHFLQVTPTAAPRLHEIETDLETRLDDAKTQQWIGDVEQLTITLQRLRAKRDDLPTPQEVDPPGITGAGPILSLPPLLATEPGY